MNFTIVEGKNKLFNIYSQDKNIVINVEFLKMIIKTFITRINYIFINEQNSKSYNKSLNLFNFPLTLTLLFLLIYHSCHSILHTFLVVHKH